VSEGLCVEDLQVRFGDVVALDGMTLTVEEGRLVGFLGPNGAGKTTTMRSVLGLVTPQHGHVRWRGAPIDVATRRRIGYMPEERGLYARMRLLDQVTYFGRLAGMGTRPARTAARAWLERLDLGDRLDAHLQDLSHGNQQRVQLAVALVHDPELLILDEPFSGLDPVAVQTMSSVIAERAAAGTSVLFSSHQLDLVEELCEHVVIVNRGRVVTSGTVTALRDAAPDRRVSVTYTDGRRDERTVARDTDLDDLLREVRAKGTVSGFTYEPPSLGELFLAAVRA
jgi:ABC-2 type transport system ATP-binding protein